MSQDLRRERAGAKFETIAGATNYIAELEAKAVENDAYIDDLQHQIMGYQVSGEYEIGYQHGSDSAIQHVVRAWNRGYESGRRDGEAGKSYETDNPYV